MNDDNRVYFIGAGASKQDRFPLTDELKYGIAWAILQGRPRFELLDAHLQYLYNVRDAALERSAIIWEGLRRRANDQQQTDRCQRLMIDPHNYVAGEREDRATCVCKCRFSELIVTPGFVREYRNVHLLTIWREALLALAAAAQYTAFYWLMFCKLGQRSEGAREGNRWQAGGLSMGEKSGFYDCK